MDKLLEFLRLIYNSTVFYQFMGAIISIAITVAIIFLKQYQKRKQRKSYYEGMSAFQELGDINIKVDEDLPYESVSKIAFIWCLQPLLLIFLLSFIDNKTEYIKFIIFITVLITTILHEFMACDEYIDKNKYRFFLIFIWIISFLSISYEYNMNDKRNTKIKKSSRETAVYYTRT